LSHEFVTSKNVNWRRLIWATHDSDVAFDQ